MLVQVTGKMSGSCL